MAPRTTLPEWATDAPERLLYAANHIGRWELFAWDRAADSHRQLTERREGTMHGTIDPIGERVWWFDDSDGDELGRWMIDTFAGGERLEAAPELGRAYDAGLSLGRALAVVGRSIDDGASIHVLRPGQAAQEIYRSNEQAWVGGLSDDERLLCFHHSEAGDSRNPDLRVVELDGTLVGDLADGPGHTLTSAGFPPLAGDERVLVLHERDDLKRPLIWSPRTGEQRLIELDLPGDVEASWYADGKAILIAHEHAGRSQLYRYDLAAARLEPLPTQPGTIVGATARPDGSVWYMWTDAATPAEIRSTSGEVILRARGEAAPGGVRYSDLWVDGIHAFVAEPLSDRPHPTIFIIHGGPEAHDRDTFSPIHQAWVDHGLAVVSVNYRGSTGYGRAWREALAGNPGLTELDDIGAVWERVVTDGISDRNRVIFSGASWGGYLTLLGVSLQPEKWALGVAAVPVADYIAAYEDEMDPLKAYDRSLFGAAPEDDAQRYIERSPLTYVERIGVPLLILAGENAPRCPIRQIDNYLARLAELGKPHEVLRFDAGHGSLRTDERIRQTETELDFVARHLGTTAPL